MLRSGHLGAFFRDTGSLLTIHNIAYQGQASRAALDGAATFIPGYVPDAWVNLLALGIQNAGVVTAVSPTFAAEMRTPLGGMGLDGVLRSRGDRVRGVLNGIDTREFDPATDPRLPAHYDVDHPEGKAACKRALQEEAGLAIDPSLPLLGMVSRLVDQKGFDLVADTLPRLIPGTPLQVVILGTGQPRYEALLRLLQERYPDRVRAFFAFDAALAQRIYAGSDMFLMPSLFEPCGLGQLIAMRYGTVPVVRAVGGLLDTVHEGPTGDPGTGFVFWLYEAGHLEDCLYRAIHAFQRPREWSQIVRNDLLQDYSWERSARVYARLYESAHDPAIPLPVE
jgi:starch synthase